MAYYQKAKDIFIQRRTIDERFEEYALIVSPNSFVMLNGAMDLVTLSTASIGGLIGDNYTVKASATDDIPNFLENKLVAGTNIVITKLNTGADESLRITATAGVATGSQYPITASYSLTAAQALSVISASVATTASYASTSSYSQLAFHSLTATNAEGSLSSSYAITASYALNSTPSGTSLNTGSIYPITSSWAQLTTSASAATYAWSASNAGMAFSASNAASAYLATTASNAASASSARWAYSASFATSASSAATTYYAVTASQAYYAPTANSASFAASASAATYAWSASNAGIALTASMAASASSAVHAYSADTASSAASAYLATTASQAYYAPTANSASFSTSASAATYAWSASNAGTALTASSAASAYLATTASNAASASSARWAWSASFATSASAAAVAYVATTASSAASAYLATTASQAAYAPLAFSASYAITTSYYISSQIFSLNTTQSMLATSSIAANSSIYASQSLWATSSLTSTSSLSASYALTASLTFVAITSSQSTSASFATYAWSASNAGIAFSASNAASASFAKTAFTASSAATAYLATTSSEAYFARTANIATTASQAATAYVATTASYAGTASYALNSGPGGTSLTTASLYPITASWALTASYATGTFVVDGVITSSNINNGIPQSFTWENGLEGSYFANWNSATYVSEMLRFFAGAFSSSFPNPSPNTRTYSNITVNQNNQGSTVTINGRIPSGSTNVNLNYIVAEGWANTGSQVFASPTFRNSQTFNTTYDSVIGGSTGVSSSIGAQAFGLGPLNNGTLQTFRVSSSVSIKFYGDTGSVATYTTATQSLYSQSLENTTGTALSLAKIPSANPAVIPAAFQDARYAGITGSGLRWNGGTNDLTNISASGKYEITASLGINSGSSPYSYLNATSVNYYYTPITDGTFAANTLALVSAASGSLTATSRSLSGVPYLCTGSSWFYTFTGSGAFNPLYNNGTISQIVSGSNAASASTYSTVTASVSTANGTVNAGNSIVNSSTLVARPFGTLPVQDDYIVYGVVLVASGSACTNITRSGVSNDGIPISASMLTRAGATSYFGQMSIPYHIPGTFGQPIASGSLAYWGRPQSFSVSTETGTTETFMDEVQRVYLSNDCLAFTSSYFTSSQYISDHELQVKPGFLVSPSGSFRYWYPSGYGVETKYYVRHFRRSTTVTQLIIDPFVTIVNWDDTTTPGISIALLFESAKSGVFGNCRLYDINKLVGSIQNNVAPDNFQNPFNQNVDIYYNGTGNKSGTQITVPIVNANGMYLDGTSARDEFYLIIRYKGDPSPLMRISVT